MVREPVMAMDPLNTPPRSDSEPIGAPTPRPYEPVTAPPPSPPPAEPRERLWTGNRPFPRLEPVTGAIVGGLALILLGFLVLVAPSVIRWVLGFALIAFGIGAMVWANARTNRTSSLSDVPEASAYGRY